MEELECVRRSHIALFKSFDDAASPAGVSPVTSSSACALFPISLPGTRSITGECWKSTICRKSGDVRRSVLLSYRWDSDGTSCAASPSSA